jgi:DNA-binding MarR family transcriptional regulator
MAADLANQGNSFPRHMTKKRKYRSGTSGHDPDWEIDENGVTVLGNLIGYNLRRAHALQRQRFADAFKPEGIRPVQLSMLGLIHNNSGVTPSDLGRVLDIKRTNVVPLIDELRDRGLVERKQSRTDGRVRVLALTRKGERLTRKLLDRHDRLEEDLARQLGPRNRKQLLRLLAAFRGIGPARDLDD